MADGTTYSINIESQGVGLNATASSVNELAASLSAAEAVITPFDQALSAAERELTAAGEAAQSTADDLAAAEKEFARLERASMKAEKAVGKAAAKGRDTAALRAQALSAAEAVKKQALAVDKARDSATEAAAAERKLAASLRTVQRAADQSAAAMRAGPQRTFGDVTASATAMGGTMGGLVGMITGVVEGLGRGGAGAGLVAGLIGAAIWIKIVTTATIGLIGALGSATIKMAKMALESRKAYGEAIAKQSEKLKKNILGLFLGVKVDKLMRPMKLLAKFFDRNTASGAALAKIIEMMMNPLLEGLDKASPKIYQFFQGGIIAALDLIIIVLKVRNGIAKMIPKAARKRLKELANDIASLTVSAKGGEMVFKALGLVFLGLGIAIALVLSPFLILIGLMALVVAPIVAVITVVALAAAKTVSTIRKWKADLKAESKGAGDGFTAGLVEGFMGAISTIADIAAGIKDAFAKALKGLKSKGRSAADNFIAGIVSGVAAGAGPFAQVLVSLAKGGVKAFKDAMEIKSPSRVMREAGLDTAKGAEEGVEEGSDGVQDAMARMMVPERTKKEAAKGRGRAEGGRGRARGALVIESLQIPIYAPTGDGEDIARAVQQALTRLLEATAGQIGGFAPGGSSA